MLEHDSNILFMCATLEDGDCPAQEVREFYSDLTKPLDPKGKIPIDDPADLDSICRGCSVFEPKTSTNTIEGYEISVEVERRGGGWWPKAIRVDHPIFRGRIMPPPDLPDFNSVNEAYEVGEMLFSAFLETMPEEDD
jgi:hypothetical protein